MMILRSKLLKYVASAMMTTMMILLAITIMSCEAFLQSYQHSSSVSISANNNSNIKKFHYLKSHTSAQINNVIEGGVSSLLVSVDTFDGSGIDPVVVGTAFWSGFTSKLIGLILGQIAATIVFGALCTFIVKFIPTILPKVADQVVTKVKYETSRITTAVNNNSGNRNMNIDIGKLIICLLIDTIGTSSEFVPFIGEVTDVAWAPLASIALRSLYGSNIVFGLEFIEEILPFTDFLPLATICWVIETFYPDGDVARGLGIGAYSKNFIKKQGEQDIIDVSPTSTSSFSSSNDSYTQQKRLLGMTFDNENTSTRPDTRER